MLEKSKFMLHKLLTVQNFQIWWHLKENWKTDFAFEKADSYDFENKYRNPLQKFLNFSLSSWLTEQFTESQAASCMLPGNLKRVTGRIFTISKCFHRSKPKLYLLISP
jgi:hypothetical protein